MVKAVSKLSIQVSANTMAVTKGFDKIDRSAKKLRGNLAKGGKGGSGGVLGGMFGAGMAKGLGKAIPLLGAYLTVMKGIRTVSNGIKEASARVDSLAKASRKLGMTTEALNGLRFAGEQTGVASNTMDMALQRLGRRLAQAAHGAGEAAPAIAQLGLDAKELAQMSPDQAFLKITDAMKKVTNQNEKLRLSQKLFDSEGVALVNTMAAGSAAIQNMMDKGNSLNGITSENAAKFEAFNDATKELKLAIEGLWQEVGLMLLPLLVDFVETLKGATMAAKRFFEFLNKPMFGGAGKSKAAQGIGKLLDFDTVEAEAKKAKKQLEDIKKQGDAIRDAVATPAERARKKLADLSRLYKLNAIDAATFARATAAAHKELFDSIEKEEPAQLRPGVGAAGRGTTAGFSAVQRGREAARTAVDQRKRLIREAEKRRRLLEQISTNTNPANARPCKQVTLAP